MQPKELAQLYNYIRHMGGYRGFAMTDIAGMMIHAERWSTRSRNAYAICRYEQSEWAVHFSLAALPRESQENGFRIWLRPPSNKNSVFIDVGDYAFGIPRIIRIDGDYDAYQRDASLLKMFSSVWEETDG